MRVRKHQACAWLAGLALTVGHIDAGHAADIISSDTVSDAGVPIAVRGVSMSSDGAVTGVLVNQSANPVRDPQVLVQYQWLWIDERHPGGDNPGFSDTIALRGEIPPGGRLPFSHVPAGGLPQRRDGRFEPAARVMSFTEVMPAGTSSSDSDLTEYVEYVPRGAAAAPVVAEVRPRPLPRGDIISSGTNDQARAPVFVRSLAMTSDGTVTGELVNGTGHVVRDPEVLVRFEWLWADEFHPGSDNPGWTDTVTVRGDIPPGGRLPFVHTPAGALPQRADGRFEPQASVLSFTEVFPPETRSMR